MKQLFRLFVLIAVATGATAAEVYKGFGPEYRKIRDIKQQKQAFVEVLLPKIREANAAIEEERRFVKEFFTHYLFTYNVYHRDDIIRLSKIAKRYRIKNLYDEKSYMLKIAPVPTSLVLAQAAVESAWGKSRFVELANNIFGEWTYGEKGIVPESRTEGMKHKIRIFDTLEDSIAGYMLNLNRNAAYREFRAKRLEYLRSGKVYTGMAAADTMEKYSGIGEKYNALLKKLIRSNRFARYDAGEGADDVKLQSGI